MNTTKSIMNKILTAAIQSGVEFNAEEQETIRELQEMCNKAEEGMLLNDLAQSKCYILWAGVEDVRSIIDSGIFSAEISHMSEAEIEALCNDVVDDVNWPDVESASIEAGNILICDSIENALSSRSSDAQAG